MSESSHGNFSPEYFKRIGEIYDEAMVNDAPSLVYAVELGDDESFDEMVRRGVVVSLGRYPLLEQNDLDAPMTVDITP